MIIKTMIISDKNDKKYMYFLHAVIKFKFSKNYLNKQNMEMN